jgi:hypothetical protein
MTRVDFWLCNNENNNTNTRQGTEKRRRLARITVCNTGLDIWLTLYIPFTLLNMKAFTWRITPKVASLAEPLAYS